jgi:hypothetical protein
MADAQFLREEGNRHFKEGDIDSADQQSAKKITKYFLA